MSLTDYFECTIDFKGQRLAERLTYGLLGTFSVIGFLAGYASESLSLTLAIFALGVITACLVALPPWPMYRRHAVQWLSVDTTTTTTTTTKKS
ncbi:hypothetical protein [Absidia glauca]|uniref:Signal peptidase complex subunit 1 n=1 Tax=Absidia glauca TaxID=4829 RepID=A0A168QD27_ABSGL|nr:hypothetical protein [Absidia glauca]